MNNPIALATLITGEKILVELVIFSWVDKINNNWLARDIQGKLSEPTHSPIQLDYIKFPPNIIINYNHIVKIELEPEFSKLHAILKGEQTRWNLLPRITWNRGKILMSWLKFYMEWK